MSNLDEVAPALLGSTLLINEETYEASALALASSGNLSIDREALDGGFRYGEITTIAGGTGTGKTTLAYQAIVSHLVTYKEGQVALIATTEPALARLRNILVARIEKRDMDPEYHESGYVYSKQSRTAQPAQNDSGSFLAMLDRVRISRVFDFPGVAEAITEFGTQIEDSERSNGTNNDAEENWRSQGIVDSEDEDEILTEANGERHSRTVVTKNHASGLERRLYASMIVIDNIANVVGSMMTKSQVQGHAILATVMRSIHHLARRRNICVVIVNAAVGFQPQHTQYHRKESDDVSMFASTPGKPALGKHFAYLVGTSIYLSTLPRSKEDADTAYSDVHGAKQFHEVRIIEVLKDRYGSREGRWCAFTIAAGTELQSVRL
ncbi:MAG: hypothetical protein Q9170_007669 [Blastenia crenularia]